MLDTVDLTTDYIPVIQFICYYFHHGIFNRTPVTYLLTVSIPQSQPNIPKSIATQLISRSDVAFAFAFTLIETNPMLDKLCFPMKFLHT